jgi:hypothetical protein
MVEDKWNARAEGRREQKTRLPTGGRGAQGGLRIGEMERDAILGHGISAFTNESYMLRSDGTSFNVCKGCGTIPIENPKTGLFVCPLCTGPVSFVGSSVSDMELIPPTRKTMVAPVTIEMPYAFKLLCQELETYMNIGMRIMTEKDLLRLNGISKEDLGPVSIEDGTRVDGKIVLKERKLPEYTVPEFREVDEVLKPSAELLAKLGSAPPNEQVLEPTVEESRPLDIAKALETIQAQQATVPGSMIQTAQGKAFQPNPITIFPSAQPIQTDEFEDLTPQGQQTQAGPQVPQQVSQTQAGPQQVSQVPQQVTATSEIPQLLPQVPQGQQQGGYYMMPYQQSGQTVNMGPPVVYSQSPAQLFTSGIGGAPPTFAIDTSAPVMGGFLNTSMGPDARRSNITLKRNRVSFGSQLVAQEQSSSGGSQSDAGMRVTVVKGN